MVCIKVQRQPTTLFFFVWSLVQKQGPERRSRNRTQAACATSTDAVNLCLGKYSQNSTVVVTELSAWGWRYHGFSGVFYCFLHILPTTCFVLVFFVFKYLLLLHLFIVVKYSLAGGFAFIFSSICSCIKDWRFLTQIPFLFHPHSAYLLKLPLTLKFPWFLWHYNDLLN